MSHVDPQETSESAIHARKLAPKPREREQAKEGSPRLFGRHSAIVENVRSRVRYKSVPVGHFYPSQRFSVHHGRSINYIGFREYEGDDGVNVGVRQGAGCIKRHGPLCIIEER